MCVHSPTDRQMLHAYHIVFTKDPKLHASSMLQRLDSTRLQMSGTGIRVLGFLLRLGERGSEAHTEMCAPWGDCHLFKIEIHAFTDWVRALPSWLASSVPGKERAQGYCLPHTASSCEPQWMPREGQLRGLSSEGLENQVHGESLLWGQ